MGARGPDLVWASEVFLKKRPAADMKRQSGQSSNLGRVQGWEVRPRGLWGGVKSKQPRRAPPGRLKDQQGFEEAPGRYGWCYRFLKGGALWPL